VAGDLSLQGITKAVSVTAKQTGESYTTQGLLGAVPADRRFGLPKKGYFPGEPFVVLKEHSIS
jgi:hypothetical protein